MPLNGMKKETRHWKTMQDPNDNIEKKYIDYANRLVLCGNEEGAAAFVGIAPINIQTFIMSARVNRDVLQIIAEDETSVPDFTNKEDVKRHVLSSLWKESKKVGAGTQQAARIAALRAIGDLTGIEPPKQVSVDHTNGGVLAVPCMDINDWEKQSENTQKLLKETVRD